MCKKKYKPFKKKLEELRRSISTLSKGSCANFANDVDGLPGDFADVASVLQQNTTAAVTQALLKRQLDEVEVAFRRIELGTYGICLNCTHPIALERLKHLPQATHCIQCASKIQRAQRLSGKVFPGTRPSPIYRRIGPTI